MPLLSTEQKRDERNKIEEENEMDVEQMFKMINASNNEMGESRKRKR